MCGRYRFGYAKIFGVTLIVLGAIILFSSLPYWMWLALIGTAMIVIGVVILKTGR